jgi:hypothetical protein
LRILFENYIFPKEQINSEIENVFNEFGLDESQYEYKWSDHNNFLNFYIKRKPLDYYIDFSISYSKSGCHISNNNRTRSLSGLS